jgi:hypothetical protein
MVSAGDAGYFLNLKTKETMKYKGQLEGFPEHIVEAMLDEQVRQGNKRDVTVFENFKSESKTSGGFTWADHKLGHEVWKAVIEDKDFYLIPIPQPISKPYPKKMIVADIKSDLIDNPDNIGTVLCEYNGKFLAIPEYEESVFGKRGIIEQVLIWDFAKDIHEEVIELTLQDISDGKGVGIPPHLIKIVNSNK